VALLREGNQRGAQHGVMTMAVYDAFCDAVLEHIPRATHQEREEIRGELCAHLEDHRDMLVEHGMQWPEATAKAIEAMGPADEIGQAWNKQLSPVWLWIGRACQTLFVLLFLLVIPSVISQVSGVWENIQARTQVLESVRPHEEYQTFWSQELDIRQEFGEHMIRLYRVELGTIPNDVNGPYYAQVYTLSYPKNPFHNALDVNILMLGMTCNGTEWGGSGGGGSGLGLVRWRSGFFIEKNEPTINVELEHMGNRFYAEIPLDWGGAP